MSSARWQRMNELFHDALAVPVGERDGFLAQACGDDPAMAGEIAQLLAAHVREGGIMERPAVASAPPSPVGEPATVVGSRFGPYQVIRELGRGGMGAVYLAQRVDGAFEQRVALKLIKRGMDSEQVVARFRAERQILASLEHPNIARLLDGGASDEGQPYFVMEYIDGQRIDEFAREHRLTVVERLELWLRVCSAVSYAHQHLVVHRDIKPANVVVTADGVPKLLDFGIARLLDPTAEVTVTAAELRMLTPEYASPEQIEGRHATTVSDVYSLGVVLYELLTKRLPYRARSRSPEDIAEAMRTTEPVRPSAAAGATDADVGRRLRGDLDTILLMALRKEPARRYPSVEQFAGDVRRHLEGLPVRARSDTFGYRAGKFMGRHRAGVAAAALVTLALIAGTAATAWQARQARAAQAIAERRFDDVRALAHAVLFDYHDAIRDLPGSTPVRERLVRDALRYLDALARESQGDRSLQRELAAAYERVGDVQGGNLTGNLGDTKGALESYGKAQQILETLLAADSGDGRTRRDLARTAVERSNLVFDAGDIAASMALARRAEEVLRPLAGDSMDAGLRLALNQTDDMLGVLMLETGDPRAAAERHRVAIRRMETAPPAEQATPAFRRSLSVAHQHLGDAIAQLGDLPATLESYQRARAIRVALVAEFPGNEDYQKLLANVDFWIAGVLAGMARYEEALVKYRALLARDSAALIRDPRNAAVPAAIAFSLARVGDMLLKLGNPGEALGTYQQSRTIRVAALRSDSTNLFKRFQVIEAQASVCRAIAATAPGRADRECERAGDLMQATTLEPSNAGYRGYLAGAYSDLADVYDSLGQRGTPEDQRRRRLAALELYRESSAIWSDLDERGLVNPADTGRVAAAREAVARAEKAVR